MHKIFICMIIFICHFYLSIYSYAFENKSYYNSSGSKISKAEYDERCAKQSLKFAELKQLLKVDSQKQNDSQDVLTAFPKSAHGEPIPQKALLLAQADTDAMNLQNDATDVDEIDEDEYDEDEYEDDEYDDDEEYADEEDIEIIPDPFIVLNTAFYHVNDKLYFWLLKPVSKGYGIIIPQELRGGIRNVFYNIRFPVRFINCLLQGKFRKSGGGVRSILSQYDGWLFRTCQRGSQLSSTAAQQGRFRTDLCSLGIWRWGLYYDPISGALQF